MKLFQKGVLLIAIPIVGQFAFVLFLIGAHRSSEELAWKDMHFRTQTQELMAISILTYKAIGGLSIYGMGNETGSLRAFDQQYEQLQRKVEMLSLMDRANPSETTKKAKSILKRVLSSMYAARQAVSLKTAGSGPSLILVVSELRKEIEELLTILEKLITERVGESLTDTQQLERSRWIFLVSIVSGFSINMLVAAVLLLVYARDFAKRFNIVVDNTRRVPEGLPLNQRIDGHDEIADLDRTFHEMNESLKAAEARKQQLMSMVSHDIRGPLTSVQITLEILLNRSVTQVSDQVHKRLNDMDKLVQRLSRMVNDVLDFDKLKVGKLDLTLDMVSIRDVIDECINELLPLLTKQDIGIDVSGGDHRVIADRERLPQVLVNLIANAAKFTPRGARIMIYTVPLAESGNGEDEMLKIAIRDEGPGVSEKYRETIFLPFEQVPDDKRPKAGSSGLGLPICKMLVELHGGKIGVDVPSSGGSIFWFTLPLAVVDEL